MILFARSPRFTNAETSSPGIPGRCERLRIKPTVDITCYRLGPATILHLPGEAFVEYQLFAQSLRPDNFAAVAAYGELGTGYICTDKAFAE